MNELPKPEFMLIGGMKCGTTTLHHHLDSHPDIFMCRPKEPQYFSRDHVYQNGVDWYLNLFSEARAGQVCGEASACYTNWPKYPNAAERVFQFDPQVKLVYMLRDPVDRAYSHYVHNMNYEWPDREYSFKQAVEEDPNILDASKYMLQINQYLQYFSKDQIQFLYFEDLIDDLPGVLQKMQQLLGVSDFVIDDQQAHLNAGGGEALTRRRIKRFLRKVRRAPLLSPLFDVIPEEKRQEIFAGSTKYLLGSVVGERMKKVESTRYEPKNEKIESFIKDYVRDDLRALAEFLGELPPQWASKKII